MIWVLLFIGSVWSQIPNENLQAPGQLSKVMQDSQVVAVAGTDTSLAIWIGGADSVRIYAEYESRNDSINVAVWLDIAPINKPEYFVQHSKIDSMLISGTNDSTHYLTVTGWPRDALYGRLRAVGAMAAGDTVDVTTVLTLLRMPGSRFR